MKIAIWTKSPPKIAAIEEAIKKCIYFEWQDIEIIPLKVSSDISDMPISIDENMTWARNRANNAKKEVEADFYIGMEWGTSKLEDKAYLFWVVYILDNTWKWHFWFSNMMEVPNIFEKWIYEDWKELGPLSTEISWEEWHRRQTWSFWLWSDDMITRKEQFMFAFLSAIPPFYNKYYKI